MSDRGIPPPSVVVLGSLHMDLIGTAAHLPGKGASVLGRFAMAPGGKGAAQAVQMARLGLRVALITQLGRDQFGDTLAAAMVAFGVDPTHIARHAGAATGASTVITAGGEYFSVIDPGAAGRLGLDAIEAAGPAIAAAQALVLQLEVPPALSARAAEIAAAAGVPVVLNTAPPTDWDGLPASLRAATGLLVANAAEVAVLIGRRPDARAPDAALEALMRRTGVPAAAITFGADGAAACYGGQSAAAPSWPVAVVDTVGAGDAFLGAFVAAWLRGAPPAAALRRATAAGALAVGRAGAIAALPDLAELDAALARGAVA